MHLPTLLQLLSDKICHSPLFAGFPEQDYQIFVANHKHLLYPNVLVKALFTIALWLLAQASSRFIVAIRAIQPSVQPAIRPALIRAASTSLP
jgi:hypothetical protein